MRGELDATDLSLLVHERELEVLRLVARGLPNREMAQRLVIAEGTVHQHVQHIYNKLGVSTRAAATLFAMQHDLLGEGADIGSGGTAGWPAET